jgi:hypothetical protein
MKLIITLTLLLAGVAHATGSPPAPEVPDTRSRASSESQAAAVGIGVGVAKAEGGDAQSTSAASQNQTQSAVSGAEATNAGNSQSVNTKVERSAPSLGQGGLYNSGCGAGVNGGGSSPGGAGFLGATWTTHDCYLFLLAQRYESIGMADTACDVLNSTRAARKAFERLGIERPDCKLRQPSEVVIEHHAIPVQPAIDLSKYVTREELAERDRRIMRKAAGK